MNGSRVGLALVLLLPCHVAGQDTEAIAEAARAALALREAVPVEAAACGAAVAALYDAREQLAAAAPAESSALLVAEQIQGSAQSRLAGAVPSEWEAYQRLLLGSVSSSAIDEVLRVQERLAVGAPAEWAAWVLQ